MKNENRLYDKMKNENRLYDKAFEYLKKGKEKNDIFFYEKSCEIFLFLAKQLKTNKKSQQLLHNQITQIINVIKQLKNKRYILNNDFIQKNKLFLQKLLYFLSLSSSSKKIYNGEELLTVINKFCNKHNIYAMSDVDVDNIRPITSIDVMKYTDYLIKHQYIIIKSPANKTLTYDTKSKFSLWLHVQDVLILNDIQIIQNFYDVSYKVDNQQSSKTYPSDPVSLSCYLLQQMISIYLEQSCIDLIHDQQNSYTISYKQIDQIIMNQSNLLDQFLKVDCFSLQSISLESLLDNESDRICFFINIYNLLYMHMLLFYPYCSSSSLSKIPYQFGYRIANQTLTLHDIEYHILKNNPDHVHKELFLKICYNI